MPPREWRIRIEDILECIIALQEYTRDSDFTTFITNRMLRQAVERNFITIGEAASHVPAAISERHPSIPWAELRGMRHAIVHEYFGVNLHIIWDTIRDDLPPLVEQLRRMLEVEQQCEGPR